MQRAAEEARARGAQWLHVDYEPHLAGFQLPPDRGRPHAALIAISRRTYRKAAGTRLIRRRGYEAATGIIGHRLPRPGPYEKGESQGTTATAVISTSWPVYPRQETPSRVEVCGPSESPERRTTSHTRPRSFCSSATTYTVLEIT